MSHAALIPNVVASRQQPTTAIVEETITQYQRGRVKFMGTYWFARFSDASCKDNARPSTVVRVLDREGLTLLVAMKN